MCSWMCHSVTHFKISEGNCERVVPCVLGCVTVSHTLQKFLTATAKELVHVLLDVTHFETSAGNWERVVRSLGCATHTLKLPLATAKEWFHMFLDVSQCHTL